MSKLPAAPAEVPVQSDLSVLAPFFREAVERVVADMKAWGYTPQVFETMRTNERQAFLYGARASAPGPVGGEAAGTAAGGAAAGSSIRVALAAGAAQEAALLICK